MEQPIPIGGIGFFMPTETDELNQKLDNVKALNKVEKAFEASKRNQNGSFKLFRDLYRLWRFYKDKGSSVKIFNPIGYTMAVGLLSKLFVKTPEIDAFARDHSWKEGSQMVKSLLEYQFDNPESDEPMDEQFISFLTELLIIGTSVAKVSWETKWITQFEEEQIFNKETGEYSFKRTKNKVKGFDDPTFEHIPVNDVYYQPGATSIDSSKYIIFKKLVDIDYLKEKEKDGIYKNIGEVQAKMQAKADESGVEAARGQKGKGIRSGAHKDKIELLEYWEDDQMIVVANREVILRNEDNPFDHGKKPFIKLTMTKSPHEFYGIGVFEPIQDLHKAVNITLTQRIEYVTNLLNQQFAVVGTSVDEEALIEGYPIVHMDDANAVAALQKGNIPQPVFLTGSEINTEIERATGVSGYTTGTPAASSDKTKGTKGGIEAIVQEAQTRFNLILRRFENNVLRKTARLFLDLDKQYLPETEEKIILIKSKYGRYGMPFVKQVLNMADWQIEIVPGSVGFIDKQLKFENFIKWLTLATQYMPGMVNVKDAIIEAADYLGIEDAERFMMEQPPMAEMPQEEEILPESEGMPMEGEYAPNIQY